MRDLKFVTLADSGNKLREISGPVDTDIDDHIVQLLDFMEYQLRLHGGVGISAIQVNQPLRVMVVDTRERFADQSEAAYVKGAHAQNHFILANPQIVYQSEEMSTVNEGCLSLPDVPKQAIRRPAKIVIEYDDMEVLRRRKSETYLRALESRFGLSFDAGSASGPQTPDDEPVRKTMGFFGYMSHIVQHEIDHFNGVLIIDKVKEMAPKAVTQLLAAE